jgi:hypothetical protein
MRHVARLSLAIAGAGLWIAAVGTVAWAGEPANKAAASGSTAEVVGPQSDVTLLQATMRTSTPADLELSTTLECSIVTDVTTMGNDDQSASATIEVWVEIDGQPVPVSTDDEGGGRVVVCNRSYRRQTLNFEDEDATIATFLSTRSAHGFNWVALNVGNGVHDIQLKATLSQEATDNANAEGVVGNRTLVVEPIHTQHDEEVAPSDPPSDGGGGGGSSVIPGIL